MDSIVKELLEILKGLMRHSGVDEYKRPHQYKWYRKAESIIQRLEGDDAKW